MMQNVGALLSELRALLQARGCKVTELSITLSPGDDETGWEPDLSQVCVALACDAPSGGWQR